MCGSQASVFTLVRAKPSPPKPYTRKPKSGRGMSKQYLVCFMVCGVRLAWSTHVTTRYDGLGAKGKRYLPMSTSIPIKSFCTNPPLSRVYFRGKHSVLPLYSP